MSALYCIVSGVACLFSTTLIKKIGIKKCMVLGAICDTIWVIGCIPVALATENPDSNSFFLTNGFIIFINIFVNLLGGCSTAILWVANGVYIANCATEMNKGFYISYFNGYFLIAGVFGNLISAVVL